MNPNDLRDKLILETHSHVTKLVESSARQEERLSRIEVDVSKHIKRTDLLEARVDGFQKYIYMFHGATGTALLAGGILKYWDAIAKFLKLLR